MTVDFEQILIFVRFLDIENKLFREELLTILTFKSMTCEKYLFMSFNDIMIISNLSYNKIVSIFTDGAPALMGKEKGLVKRIPDINLPNMFLINSVPLRKTLWTV